MTRVAGIDCGTNTIRLLVADVDTATGAMTDVERTMKVVRLGQGVDRTGRIAPEALERALAATRRYAARCAELGVEAIRFVATSATRDAENRREFVDGVRIAIGVEPEVIDGEEEARLSFRGAIGAIGPRLPGPFLVVDLGGGSTELVLGTVTPVAAYSMDVGCVRMTERHLHSDPPTAAEIAAVSAEVTAALDAASAVVPLGETMTLVGLAGSVTSVTAHALGLPRYDPKAIDGTLLSPEVMLAAADDLLHRTHAERAALGFMHPGRVDVIGAGALVWAEVVRRVQRDVAGTGRTLGPILTSEHDILDGITLSAAGIR